jgi:hypothetical protein
MTNLKIPSDPPSDFDSDQIDRLTDTLLAVIGASRTNYGEAVTALTTTFHEVLRSMKCLPCRAEMLDQARKYLEAMAKEFAAERAASPRADIHGKIGEHLH